VRRWQTPPGLDPDQVELRAKPRRATVDLCSFGIPPDGAGNVLESGIAGSSRSDVTGKDIAINANVRPGTPSAGSAARAAPDLPRPGLVSPLPPVCV
jgi:hypothetical protein